MLLDFLGGIDNTRSFHFSSISFIKFEKERFFLIIVKYLKIILMDAPSEEELAFAQRPSPATPSTAKNELSEVVKLRAQVAQLKQENEALRRHAFEALSDSEKSQEQISNRLIRQIEKMKHERAELVNAVEAEEEYLTNVLQKRLDAVQKQNRQLEGTIDSDRDEVISRLQNQIESLYRSCDGENPDLQFLKTQLDLLRNNTTERESERT